MKIILSTLAVVCSATFASAAAYNLYDHRAGAMSGTYDYGLRMEAVAGNTAGSYWSWEDESDNSLATMIIDTNAGTGSVSGQMRSNLDNSLWDISVTMSGVSTYPGAGVGGFGASSYTAILSMGDYAYHINGKANKSGSEWTGFFADPGGDTDWRAPNITAGWLESVTYFSPYEEPPCEYEYLRSAGDEEDDRQIIDECYYPLAFKDSVEPRFMIEQLAMRGVNDFIGEMELTSVPLPAAGWLLIAGIGGLGLARRRTK